MEKHDFLDDTSYPAKGSRPEDASDYSDHPPPYQPQDQNQAAGVGTGAEGPQAGAGFTQTPAFTDFRPVSHGGYPSAAAPQQPGGYPTAIPMQPEAYYPPNAVRVQPTAAQSPGYSVNSSHQWTEGAGPDEDSETLVTGYTRPPFNWLAISILVTIFCCWPLGIPAIVYSVNAMTAVARNAMPEAYRYARLAKIMSLSAFSIGLVLVVTTLMLYLI